MGDKSNKDAADRIAKIMGDSRNNSTADELPLPELNQIESVYQKCDACGKKLTTDFGIDSWVSVEFNHGSGFDKELYCDRGCLREGVCDE